MINFLSQLSDVKVRRINVLNKIGSLLTKSQDIPLFLKQFFEEEKDSFRKGFLLQFLGVCLSLKKNDYYFKKIKDYYKSNFKKLSFFMHESFIFFFFVCDKNYLLYLKYDNKLLITQRNRFFNLNEKFKPSFLPNSSKNDLGFSYSFAMIQDMLVAREDLALLDKFYFFVYFTARFPFLSDLDLILKWCKINKEDNFNRLLSSNLFFKSGNTIVYDPLERVKVEKFLTLNNSLYQELKKTITEKNIYRKKSQLFKDFVDNFITISNNLKDTGIFILGFNEVIKVNSYIKDVLKMEDEDYHCLREIARSLEEASQSSEKVIINGITLEVKVSELIVDEINIGKMLSFRDITDEEIFKQFSSHDIKNSILSVISTFKLLKDLYDPDKEELEIINSGEKSITGLRNKFQDFFNYKSKSLHINENTDLIFLINKCALAFNSPLKEKNIQLEYIFDPNMEVIISADEEKIYRVIENLVSNAIKYSNENTKIFIDLKKDGSHYYLFIIDQGLGIDSKFGEKIFKLGQRLERDKKKEGTGIGLAIVKKFISMHGGTIEYFTNEYGGTTFKIGLVSNPEAN